MIITEIKPFGKTKSKVLTDGDFAFVLYKTEIRKLKLAEGEELPESELDEVIIPLLTKRARERIVYLLKDSDRTEAELVRKLRESCCPEPCTEKAIAWAREKHYVDDERYASCYAEYHSAGKSRRKLLYDLMQKGVAKEIAEKVLEEQPVDEEEQIRRELKKRGFDAENTNPDERKKITAALARKGYSWELIEHFLKE